MAFIATSCIGPAQRLWHHHADLVESTGSALAVLRGEVPDDIESLTLFDVAEPGEEPDLELIVAELDEWAREGMTVVTVLDDAYPTNLRGVHNRPPLLFIRGELRPEDDRSVAVVGTRRATPDGLRQAEVVAGDLAEGGYTVVCGGPIRPRTPACRRTSPPKGRCSRSSGPTRRRPRPASRCATS